MAENTPLPAFYASLLRIHAIITRGLDITLENSQKFASTGFPNKKTGIGFSRYAQSLLAVLHTHHRAEEEVAFPYVRARLPGLRIEPLIMQHQQILPHYNEMKTILDRMDADSDPNAALQQLVTTCTNLRILWMLHKAAEEGYFISSSQTARELNEAEQAELTRITTEYSQKNTKPEQWIVPFLLYNLPPTERSLMAQNMPPQVTNMLVPIVWKNEWAPMKPFLLD